MKRTTIVIHHSAGTDHVTRDWETIKAGHLAKGWRDIGYHYGIEMIGDEAVILKGRSLDNGGAHCPAGNMNRVGIGICVIGNYQLAAPSPLIINKLSILCKMLCTEHNIPPEMILPHKQFKATLCPGQYFPMKYLVDLVSTMK